MLRAGRSAGKAVVGSLEGSLLLRGPSGLYNFHSICDDLSQELQEISTTFCNADGSLRPDNIDGLSVEEDHTRTASASSTWRRSKLTRRTGTRTLEPAPGPWRAVYPQHP